MSTTADDNPGRIFISYRRDETAYPAGWLFDQLARHFGRDKIFKDVDSIELGDDFVEVISVAVGSCDVLLALIGNRWLTITDKAGRRRLDDPRDFVRLEIEAALTREVRVIPILVEGAQMPSADELPASLAKLVRLQALELSPIRFDSETARLLKILERTLKEAHGRSAVTDQGQGTVQRVEAREKARQEVEPTAADRRKQIEQLEHQGQQDERETMIVSPPLQAVSLPSLASPPREMSESDKLSAPAVAASPEILQGHGVDHENAKEQARHEAEEAASPPTAEQASRAPLAAETEAAASAETETPILVTPKASQSQTWILSRPRRQYVLCLIFCVILLIGAVVGINNVAPRSGLSAVMAWIIILSLAGALLSLGFFLYARRHNSN